MILLVLFPIHQALLVEAARLENPQLENQQQENQTQPLEANQPLVAESPPLDEDLLTPQLAEDHLTLLLDHLTPTQPPAEEAIAVALELSSITTTNNIKTKNNTKTKTKIRTMITIITMATTTITEALLVADLVLLHIQTEVALVLALVHLAQDLALVHLVQDPLIQVHLVQDLVQAIQVHLARDPLIQVHLVQDLLIQVLLARDLLTPILTQTPIHLAHLALLALVQAIQDLLDLAQAQDLLILTQTLILAQIPNQTVTPVLQARVQDLLIPTLILTLNRTPTLILNPTLKDLRDLVQDNPTLDQDTQIPILIQELALLALDTPILILVLQDQDLVHHQEVDHLLAQEAHLAEAAIALADVNAFVLNCSPLTLQWLSPVWFSYS